MFLNLDSISGDILTIIVKYILYLLYTEGLEGNVRQSQVQMFLLSDLYAGIVYYDQTDHKQKEPRSDFWFHLTDGENISPVARFNITILVCKQ